MRSTCGHAGICGCRLGAPPKMAVRTPPAPDWREMARALAEALEKRVHPAPVHHDQFMPIFCSAEECAKDRALLAEAKQKLGEGK